MQSAYYGIKEADNIKNEGNFYIGRDRKTIVVTGGTHGSEPVEI